MQSELSFSFFLLTERQTNKHIRCHITSSMEVIRVMVCVCEREIERGRDLEYLDPADSLLSLHHAYVLGRVPLRQQLSGAQVVSSKDNSINQVLWFAGSWD